MSTLLVGAVEYTVCTSPYLPIRQPVCSECQPIMFDVGD